MTGVVAAAILLVAAPLLYSGAESRRSADEARLAEPMRLKVNLSRPSVSEGEFDYVFHTFHGLHFQLVTEQPVTSAEEAQSLLAGLEGRLTILGPDGAIVFDEPLHADDFSYRETDGDRWEVATRAGYCPVHGLMPEGKHTLKLTVDRGAVGLTDIPHALSVQYQMCGMEYVAAQVAWLYGAVGCSISGLLVLAIVVVTIAKRSRSALATNAHGAKSRRNRRKRS